MGRYSGDHGPPKIDGSFYAGPGGYDAYPTTVPPGYASTAAAAAAAAAAAGGASVVAASGNHMLLHKDSKVGQREIL